jgi:hypothetical protein
MFERRLPVSINAIYVDWAQLSPETIRASANRQSSGGHNILAIMGPTC